MSDCRNCGRDAGKDAFACTWCAETAMTNLGHIAGLAHHLDGKRARRHSNWQNGIIGHAAQIPLPYDPRVSQVADPIRVALHGTVRIILDARSSVSVDDLDPESITSSALWIAKHCDWLRRQDVGPEELASFATHKMALEKLFDNPPDRMYVGRCNADIEGTPCRASLYVETDGKGKPNSQKATCPCCRTSHEIDDRREQLADGVADYRATIREISRLCVLIHPGMVSKTLLYEYIRGGLMLPQGTREERDSVGRMHTASTYRIGDVQGAIDKWQELRIQKRDTKRRACRVA